MKIIFCLALVLSGVLFGCSTRPSKPAEVESHFMERWADNWLFQTNQVQHEKWTLVSFKDWVYLRKGNERYYRKLIPGICPQWIPAHTGQNDRWFYLFLPVGHDGESELWIASSDGYYLGKEVEGLFFINTSPVLSPDQKTIASVTRPLTTVAGEAWSVTVIKLKQGDGQISVQDSIYETRDAPILNLHFEGNDKLSFRYCTMILQNRKHYQLNRAHKIYRL